MGERWRSVCAAASATEAELTLALAEPAYEYGWDAGKHNEL